jgi:hypothetical protein
MYHFTGAKVHTSIFVYTCFKNFWYDDVIFYVIILLSKASNMGLYTWFKDLGSFQKTSVILGSCALFCGTGYCVYKLYSHGRKVELYDESPNNGQEHKPAVQKRVLVLGLQGCGKTTFLAALANLGSGAGGTETKPTEGFNVMCVTTNGVHLNIWES